ncbi:PilN domain-containing protein [Candidatus Clostridium stratigraminis]|uniref:PilN domain-containing protein n=1 Tax=Candidatus Clostridium stratigraminis TaxID=3381661 RepID=A0ABW8T409_9CLOT
MRELNLIPNTIKEKRIQRKTFIKISFMAIIIVLLLAAGVVLLNINLNSLNAKEADLNAQVNAAKSVVTENTKLRNETSSYKEYIDLLSKIQKEKTPVYPVLMSLIKYMPKDIVISSLVYNAGTINISATAKNYNSINEFEANLQESKEFSNSSVTNITRDDKNRLNTFTLTISNVEEEVK